jgi:hypothetical protein
MLGTAMLVEMGWALPSIAPSESARNIARDILAARERELDRTLSSLNCASENEGSLPRCNSDRTCEGTDWGQDASFTWLDFGLVRVRA